MPSSYIGTTDCIVANNTYNVIPGFDFPGGDIYVSDYQRARPVSTCNSNSACIGYNSDGYSKKDFLNPHTASGEKLYVHTVQHGTFFILVQGWDVIGRNLADMPLTFLNASGCSYKCIVTTGCVGAVWDGFGHHCWLKSNFTTSSTMVGYSLMLPLGVNGCPPSYLHNGGNFCISKYNKIPNFDFSGNDISNSNSPSSNCNEIASCIGYSSSGYYKDDLQLPQISESTIFFARVVQSGIYFVQLHGWDIIGGNMANMPLTVPSSRVCAYKCTIMGGLGCVAAVWEKYTSMRLVRIQMLICCCLLV